LNTDCEDENYTEIWGSNIYLKEKIQNTEKHIKKIKDSNNELEYYTDTSDILFNYYDLIEKQSKKKQIKQIIKPTNKTILDALNNINTTDKEITENCNLETDVKIKDKSDLVDEYLNITNKNYIKKTDHNELENCKICKEPMTCFQHEAIIICEKCGFQELLLVEQNRPILKQNIKDTSHFSYKRINHFREWCNQVQGKESTDIPNEIFEKILNEIKKEKITNTKKITYSKMREILKRLRINKYYEHIPFIKDKLGIKPPVMTPELEELLCNLFMEIQGPYAKYCPDDRVNFLNYYYTVYKLCELLDQKQFLPFFPMLKDREKRVEQDNIWKKICEELDWEFIPTI